MNSANERRKRLLTEFIYEVCNKGRLDEVEKYIARHYTIWHDPGDPWEGQALDAAAFRERIRLSLKSFPEQKFAIQAIYAEGDAVIVTWIWQATGLAPATGFPPSDKEMRMSGITVYSFDDRDRLTGHWQVADRWTLQQQMQRNLRDDKSSKG